MKIAVILPSRGLMFSQTAAELLQNLQGYDYDLFFAHGEALPLCFNKPVTKALRGSYTHLFFVEEDMILSEDTLDSMLILDAPVVTMDYPVSTKGQGVVLTSKEGRVVFTGTGCLLVKRQVFDKISKPYFRTDIRWNPTNYGDFIRFTANIITNPDVGGYGLHDVTFGIKLWQAGIPISVAGTVGQRKLIKLGEAGTNEGAHQIEEWTKVKPNYLYDQFKAFPKQPIGKLISVQTHEGELNVMPDKAKKLIKAGVATRIKRQSISIDLNDVDL